MNVNTLNQEKTKDLLAGWARTGIRLRLDKGKLKCAGPPEVVTALQPKIAEHKTEIIEFLSTDASCSDQENIQPCQPRPESIPLSFAQQRLWFLQEMQPETGAYNIPFAIELEGLLDLDAFRKSLEAITARHEVFRTHFGSSQGTPHQIIQAPKPWDLDVTDLRDTYDAEEKVRMEVVRHATKTFALGRSPLLDVAIYRIEDQRFIVLFTLHHIIADGWSTDILLKELSLNYRSQLLGQPTNLHPLPIQYADFSIWQRNWLQGEVLENQLNYWRNKLGGEIPTLQLPTDFPRKRVQTFSGAVEIFTVPREVSMQLKSLAQSNESSNFMTLVAAFNLFLQRYSGQDDLLIGTPIANRQRPEVEGLIGLFVNTLVLRTRVRTEASFVEILQEVRETTLEAYQYQDLPFEKLVEALQPDRDMSLSPLFQVKFRLENQREQDLNLPGLKLRRLPQEMASAKLDLSVDMYETPDGFTGGFEYNTDLFKPETIRRMVEHFLNILQSIVQQPESPICELSLLSLQETERQKNEWNSHDVAFNDEACYHQLFESQALKTPNAIALVFDNKGDVEETLSYRELNQRANQLAHHLISLGIQPEKVVGICMDRSIDMVVAMLAVLKAGAAYLPIDLSYPEERLQFLVKDSGAVFILTHSQTSLPADTSRIDIDSLNLDTESTDNPNVSVQPIHLAYLIYTSGSAGQPKGALIPHRGLVNLTEDKIRVCDVRPGDCVLQFFSFSFDGSVPELVMTLAAGAKLLLAPSSKLLPGPDLQELIHRQKVSHITLTPSALSALPKDNYPSLRVVLVGGEAPSTELIEAWSQGRTFINAYGPTETTVNASMVVCGNGKPLVPTIRPSANKQLYVLDEALQITPIGVVGELHIGGVGLARGYHKQARLTAERFVPNPFESVESPRKYPIPLLYRTGDLASYLPDSRIRILGRVDQQTKIRGYRIEIQEVERILEQHAAVKTGLVRAREAAGGVNRLIAYGVPSTPDQKQTDPSVIRDFLSEKLPKFMLPSAFIWIDEVPMNENGKLDESALPAPENRTPGSATQPKTETEAKLCPIFAELLELPEIGTNDNFFDSGGHSLLATRLVSQILETFGVEITVIDLFDAPTVAGMALRIDQKRQIQALMNTEVEEGEREEISL